MPHGHGRYRYQNQPDIGLWKLSRLGEALGPLLDQTRMVKALSHYKRRFIHVYSRRLHHKMGLFDTPSKEDAALIQEFLDMMQTSGADFTNSFRALASVSAGENDTVA